MKFAELLNRLTGISTPIFGISWNPPEIDRDIARRVITYLEDRRVLYDPYDIETPHYCVISVIEIREYLTNELMALDGDKDIAQNLRAMRSACRKFLQRVGADEDIVRFGNTRNHWASWVFGDALGQMRGVFGLYVIGLAVQYGLDVEDELASIFPDEDKKD